MTKAAVYVRVSSQLQVSGESFETQRRHCERYAAERGIEVIHVIRDVVSGVTPLRDRPGGGRLLELVHGRQIDAVLVYQFSRLLRGDDEAGLAGVMETVADFARHGVTVHTSDTGEVNAHDFVGLLLALHQADFAARERKRIGERSKDARLEKARSGRWVGTGTPFYGFKRVGTKARRDIRLEIDEAQARVCRRIFEMYTGWNGTPQLGTSDIAAQLDAEGVPPPRGPNWRPMAVWRLLRGRQMLGEFEYGGEIIELPDLAIIDAEIFLAAQQQMTRNRRHARRNRKQDYLLHGGALRCICGRRMHGVTRPRNNRYYVCYDSHNGRLATCPLRHYLRCDEIEARVWRELVAYFSDGGRLEDGVRELIEQIDVRRGELETERDRLAKREDALELRLRELAAAYGWTDEPAVRDAMKRELSDTAVGLRRVRGELDLVRRRLDEVEQGEPQRLREWAAVVRERLASELTNKQRQQLIKALDLEVTITELDEEHYAARFVIKMGQGIEHVSIEFRLRFSPKHVA